MARLAFLVPLGVVLSSFPLNTLAGPACAKKNFQAANCVAKCKSMWGWTGAMMNTDPWGSVVKKTDTASNWDIIISQACGSTAASSTASATPTPSIAAPAANAISIPAVLATTSSAVLSTTPIASSTTLPASIASVFSRSSSSIRASSSIRPSSTVTPSTKSSEPTTSVRTLGFVQVASTKPKSSATPVATTTKAVAKPVTTTKAAQAVVTTAASSSSSTGSTDGATSNADIQAYLAGHNTIRAQHGAKALTWNDNLASKAQQWANNCVFQHSGGSLGAFGENLAAGTGSSYGIAAAIKSWTDEVSEYNPNSPVPSHFTQVVWKGTSQVGCAVQSCNGIFAASFGPAKFFVCEYSAQGNIIGQFPENVQV